MMRFRLTDLWVRRRDELSVAPAPRFRPRLEGFEDRVVPAAPAPMAPVLMAHAHASAAQVVPITVTGVQVQNGSLVAHGMIGSHAFTAPVTLSALPPAAPGATPVLNLHLNEIHLDLLGLNVDTSKICLDVTAQSGPGNLLGNLLGGVANALNAGAPLGNVLGGLTTTQLSTLTGGVTGLLNGALGRVTAPAAVSGVSGTTPGATNVLNLSLGPVNLNLLGLRVALDNCNGGPVTVNVTAQPGPGRLLGNLLGSLSHVLDGPANPTAVSQLVSHVTTAIDQLVGAFL